MRAVVRTTAVTALLMALVSPVHAFAQEPDGDIDIDDNGALGAVVVTPGDQADAPVETPSEGGTPQLRRLRP